MVFSDAVFLLLFLPVALAVYYLPSVRRRRDIQNIWLLLISLFFYAWGEPIYVLLMMVSIYVNFLFGIWVGQHNKKSGNVKKGKIIVSAACVFNLGILFVFKYLSWVLEMLNIGTLGGLRYLTLPIGISFYTFQALSYIIDVYRGKYEAQESIVNVVSTSLSSRS